MYYSITEKSIRAFRMRLEAAEKSPATIEKYVRAVRRFGEWLAPGQSNEHGNRYSHCRKLSKEALLEYRKELAAMYSAGTVNGHLSAINAYLEFIGRPDLRVGLLKVQRRAFVEECRELSEAEYRRLVSAAAGLGRRRLELVLVTLGGTGIRVSELEYITAEAVKTGRAEIRMKGKTRTILLEKKLQKKLHEYLKEEKIESGPVFRTKSGRPLDRSNLHHEMKKLCKEARVNPEKVFPHNFRHLFARVFFSIEKNIAHLADVLGHSRIETTRIYIATSAAAHGRVLSKMNLVT